MYLDILALIILGNFILIGLKRGLIVEFLSVFGIIINLYITHKLTPRLSGIFEKYAISQDEVYNYAITFVLIFIIITICVYIIGTILKKQEISLIFRLLGGVIGFGKGIIILMIGLVFFNTAQPKIKSLKKITRDSLTNEYFLDISKDIEEYIPQSFREKLREVRIKKDIKKQIKEFLGV